MEELMNLMEEYYSIFKEHFPTMCFQTDTHEELMEKMRRCIKENKPAEDLFELDYEDNEY